MSNIKNIPNHVAIICGGNRRWAKERNLPSFEGHRRGFENARKKLPEAAKKLGIKYITLWVFSTENWNREKSEVDYLMKLFVDFADEMIRICKKYKMKFHHIGRKVDLLEKVQVALKQLEEETKDFEERHFTLALNHGGRDEITRAVKRIVEKGVSVEDITEDLISQNMDCSDIPFPDLIVRTSGELRLSGFLMWEMAYSELYFPDCYFPDFDGEELKKAVESYSKRNRRFGGNAKPANSK